MPASIDPFTSAVDLAAAVRAKEVSPLELADLYLDRIDRLDGPLNAFCHRADDEVRRAAARAADAVVRTPPEELGPFHGVPLPIKDLVDVAGWPTTYGSRGASTAPAVASAPVVERLREAGFVLLGKTTTSEFGAISFTESDAHGVSRNPWDPDRTPGGSSGGAAVAVAAGMAPIAHAADGGGSIRVPAACTGLVGLKPTRGRVTNAVVEVEGFATHGVVTRTVADTAAALDVLARHDPGAWWSPPSPQARFADALHGAVSGLRVGVLTDAPIAGIAVDPACRAAVDLAVETLTAAGNVLVDTTLPLPAPEELVATFTTLWNVSAAGVPLDDPDAVEPHNRALREAARRIDSWAYAEAVQRTEIISRRIVEAFVAGFDLLVTPTTACLPPLVGAWRQGTERDPLMALLNCYPLVVFTSLANVTGLPAISVPVHQDPDTALPVGVQLVAAPWREDLLLAAANLLERAHRWHTRRPALARLEQAPTP
jgi:amidase